MALSLAAAPAIEAVKHGPGAMVAEADHLAYHAAHGHSHDMPSGHHDSGDHDHVSAAVLASPGTTFHAPPMRTLRPDAKVADGTIREGPRRPPRLMMI
jgi:hypothetical protein